MRINTLWIRTLALTLALPLVACTDGSDDTGATATDSTTTATTTTTTEGTTTEGTTTDGTTTDGTTTDGTTTTTSSSETTSTTASTTDTAGDGGFCAHQCSADADCLIDGNDLGLTCQDNFCSTDPGDKCTSDQECIAQLSGWNFGTACTAGGGECELAMQVCLEVDGAGHCVTAPSDIIACETLLLDEIQVTDIDGNPATVCGNAGAKCQDEGYCFAPCTSDADCPSDALPVCNTGTGFCECGSDADCATIGTPESSVCMSGVCGCGADQDCVDAKLGDVCNSGACGCSGDRACADVENTFDGGMISCVSP